jgi:hypothetical protein
LLKLHGWEKPTLPGASTRRCTACGIEKSLTADNFQIVPSFAKGFFYYCNDCDIELSKQKSFRAPRIISTNGKSCGHKKAAKEAAEQQYIILAIDEFP